MKRIFFAFGLVFLIPVFTNASVLFQKSFKMQAVRSALVDSLRAAADSQAITGKPHLVIPPTQSINVLKEAMIQRVKALQNLEFLADMTVKFDGMTQMGNCEAKLCSSDSMCVTINGPFGIFVGKMFATPTNFVFYDAFKNRVVTGVPSADNIAKTLRIPLSGEDFVHLMRGEAPTSVIGQFNCEFTESTEKSSDTNIIFFVRRSETFGAEYVLFSMKDKVITQFQKKSPEGKIQLNVKYSNFKNISGILLAQSIDIQSPENEATASMTLSSIKINRDIPSIRFSVPKGLETIHLD